MKVFQLKLFDFFKRSFVLKKIMLFVALFCCLFNLNAQEKSNIKLKIETGVLWDWVEGKVYSSGAFLYIEPQLKTSKNTALGLRVGAVYSTQRILTLDTDQFYIDNYSDNVNNVFPFVSTFDYYFIKNNFRPYLGIGVGYYFLTTSKGAFATNNYLDRLEINVENKLGLLLRGGLNLPDFMLGRVDLSKLILGLEFNYIPKTNVEIPNGQAIGTIVTSNIALSISHIIKSRKGSK